MRILGIDPGTKCGYAIFSDGLFGVGYGLMPGGPILASGVWDLGSRRHEGGGMRYLRLRSLLSQALSAGVDAVAYEEVRHHTGTDAAQVYGGIVATISAECEALKIPYIGIPVGAIKKFATGKGNAKKDAMLEAAKKLWPGYTCVDDNEADARFIAMVAARDLSVESPQRQGQQQSVARTTGSTPPTNPTARRPTLPTQEIRFLKRADMPKGEAVLLGPRGFVHVTNIGTEEPDL